MFYFLSFLAMQGRSQLSIDLSNVRADIKRAATKGKTPRDYTEQEMEQLYAKERAIVAKQTEENRFVGLRRLTTTRLQK